MVYLQGPTRGSKQHLYLPLTVQEPLDLLDHRTKQHSSLHSSLNLLQNPLLFGISFKTSTLLGHLGNRLQYITHLRNMLSLQCREAPQLLCLIFGCRRAQSNKFFFTLEYLDNTPYKLSASSFIEVKGPKFFWNISYLLSCYFLLTRLDQPNIIKVSEWYLVESRCDQDLCKLNYDIELEN